MNRNATQTDYLSTITLRWNAGVIEVLVDRETAPRERFAHENPITGQSTEAQIYGLVYRAADLLKAQVYGIEHDRHFLFFHTDPIEPEKRPDAG